MVSKRYSWCSIYWLLYSSVAGFICKLFKWLSTVVNFSSPMSIANPTALFDNTRSINSKISRRESQQECKHNRIYVWESFRISFIFLHFGLQNLFSFFDFFLSLYFCIWRGGSIGPLQSLQYEIGARRPLWTSSWYEIWPCYVSVMLFSWYALIPIFGTCRRTGSKII